MTLMFSIPRHLRFAIAIRQIVDRLCLWVRSEFPMMQVAAQDRAHLACALEHRLIMMQVAAQDRAHLACALEHRLIAPVRMSD